MSKTKYIYGIRPLEEAIANGKPIYKVMIRQGLQNAPVREVLTLLKNNNIPFQFVPEAKLKPWTNVNHQGVIAEISPLEFQELDEIIASTYEAGETPFIVILENITDVRNFGAIARTALCAGAHAIVVPFKGAAAINDDAIKSSSGALLKIPICRTPNVAETINNLNSSGLATLGASQNASDNFFQCDLQVPVALVLGSEDKGINEASERLCSQLVKIPMASQSVESLNVSAAAAILLFEVVRQRII